MLLIFMQQIALILKQVFKIFNLAVPDKQSHPI